MDKITPRVDEAIASLSKVRGLLDNRLKPKIGVILGSGLNDIADDIDIDHEISTAEIGGLSPSTAPSHAGRLIVGRLYGVPVLVMQGRVHLYEGYGALDVVMPVYLFARLGVTTLIVTNASGGLNPDYEAGSVAIIRDHINLTGNDPLIGVDAADIGVRFPDMSRAYDDELRGRFSAIAEKQDIALPNGIYVGVTGPSLETSAERRYFREMGGDMVGMSTVLEVIAANHAGLSVAGLSVITNKATGGPDQKPDMLEAVLENAARGGQVLRQLLRGALPVL